MTNIEEKWEEELKAIEKQRKKAKLTILGLLVFLVYMSIVAVCGVTFALFGIQTPWLDYSLLLGNVVALGLSFYIMRNAKKIKLPILFWVGVFVLIINGWQVIKFFM